MTSEVTLKEKELQTGGKCKYLVFTLGQERYGVLLSSVKEVIGLTEITAVPQVPKFFKGLINLRGRIISLVDLRIKLGLPEQEYQAKRTSVIIVEIGSIVMGVIVDNVEEVSGYEEGQIERQLEIQSHLSREYMQGVSKTGEGNMVLLVDINKVLNAEELAIVKNNSK